MKTFRNFIKDEFNLEMPSDYIPGSWFSKNGLPIMVACTCCGSTMVSPSALIDEDGQCYCSSCAGEED